MKKLFYIGAFSSLIFSCSVSKKITKYRDSKDPILNQNVNGMLSRPLLADLSVENVRKEVTYNALLKISEDERKANAMQLFLETHSCDFVVDPIYSFTKTDLNGKTKEIQIKLSGLPAKYTKIVQVDSLPKSIQQYQSLAKPVDRLNYINSIEESDPTVGVEFNLGSKGQQGLQVDFLLKNEILRAYIAAENFGNISPDFEMDFIKDGDTTENAASGSGNNLSSISLGVMKEFPVLNRLKFRAQGGLNFSNYADLAVESFGIGDIDNISRIGLRLGMGIDIRVYKNISFIVKAHSNINVLNLYSKNPTGNSSFKVKNFEMKNQPLYFIGYGVRFVF
ncbi:MAG: hypothetical protein FJZ67_09115 [Bacteroidetes bacterium]|nr:hypothetical protein [Bacteroidota bacterium]